MSKIASMLDEDRIKDQAIRKADRLKKWPDVYYLGRFVRNTAIVGGIITIVVLVMKNKGLKEDLHTSLDGYLTLANQVAMANDMTLDNFLNQLETSGLGITS